MTSRHRTHDVGTRGWFLIGFLCGATAVASIAVGLMTFVESDGLAGWLYKWQTLIGGVLALAGALVTVVLIQRQIDQARTQEDERRERRHDAARAAMPAALLELHYYAEAGLSALKAFPMPTPGRIIIQRPENWNAPTLPRVPSEAIATLQTCIETADVGPRREIAKLLANLQVCSSRLRDAVEDMSPYSETSVTAPNIRNYLADYLEFERRCDRMFRYARGEQGELAISITADDMHRAARFAGLHDYPGFTELLGRRYGPETKVE